MPMATQERKVIRRALGAGRWALGNRTIAIELRAQTFFIVRLALAPNLQRPSEI